MRDQDASLDQLSQGLSALTDISGAVSKELDEQAVMLEELDQEVAKADEGLVKVQRMADDLIKKSGGMSWFCVIVWLTLIALFLFFLLIYT